MNSMATATGGGRGVPRRQLHAGAALRCSAPATRGAAAIIFIVADPGCRSRCCCRCASPPHVLGPDDTRRAIHGSVVYAVITGWLHGAAHRAAASRPSPPPCPGWPRIGWCSASTRCWCCCWCAHATPPTVAGFGTAVLFVAAAGAGVVSGQRGHPGRGAPLGPLRHRQRRVGVRGGHRARRRRSASPGDGGVRLPARRGRAGGQAVRRHRDADRRRRRPARARVRGAGLAVLGGVHRRDHRWRRS